MCRNAPALFEGGRGFSPEPAPVGWRLGGRSYTIRVMVAVRSAGFLATIARRTTAALLAAVQVLVVLATLAEVRSESGIPPLGVTAARPASGSLAAPAGDRGATHNEATCPACAVRSLHARLECLGPLPISVAEQRTPLLPLPAVLRPVEPTAANHSRAPPVVG